MVHVQTDQCLYPVSLVEVAGLALEEHQAGWRVSVETHYMAGTLKAAWLEGEEETWAKAEFWPECCIAAKFVWLAEAGLALHYSGAWVADRTQTREESE